MIKVKSYWEEKEYEEQIIDPKWVEEEVQSMEDGIEKLITNFEMNCRYFNLDTLLNTNYKELITNSRHYKYEDDEIVIEGKIEEV